MHKSIQKGIYLRNKYVLLGLWFKIKSVALLKIKKPTHSAMRNERYKVDISGASMTFEFISEGDNGSIKKRVQYTLTHRKNVYNLAFGDVNADTDDFDDEVISNNGDTAKVLARDEK